MTYTVQEIYYTLQGEGARQGRAAVFLRFSGCNLWSGKEAHRQQAVCRFCDTTFVGESGVLGGKYESAEQLCETVIACWQGSEVTERYVVCTGGEPLLQLDEVLITALHEAGFEIAVETNGTIEPPKGIDWLCVSPKANAPLKATCGDELKLVYPQAEKEAQPECFAQLDFTHHFLQPLDDAQQEDNTRQCIEYCKQHPRWRLSIQAHKYLCIP